MKLYPYGCSPATGEPTSLVINILPGEFDPILSWPFKLIFRINVINFSEPNDTWTKSSRPKRQPKFSLFYTTLYKLWEPEHMLPLPDPTQPTLQKQLPIHSE